jgi:Ricin-type beta-trefoil lectin domain-like
MARMSTTTEPDSTSITGENIAPSQQIVRLQGGGLRFLDAHEIPQRDFNVVTRPFQNNNTQRWRLTNVGGNVHTIVQVSSGRFLDAHEIASLNFRVVTRPQQNNDTQRWRLFDFGGGFFTIQQVSSGRFLEATLDGDFQVVTRPASGSNEQTWRLGDP